MKKTLLLALAISLCLGEVTFTSCNKSAKAQEATPEKGIETGAVDQPVMDAPDNSSETDLLLKEGAVGPFAIGARFPKPGQVPQTKFEIKQTSRVEYGEGEEWTETVDNVIYEGSVIMELTKGENNTIGNIMVLSPKVKTAEGIGVGSTIEDFYGTYENVELWFTYVSGMIVLGCDKYERCQFLLSESDCKKDLMSNIESDMTVLKPSDFKKGAKIKSIRLF